MKKLRKYAILWMALAATVCCPAAHAAGTGDTADGGRRASTALDYFKSTSAVLPLVDALTRLDMADYYISGLEHTSTNSLDGQAMIRQVTDRALHFTAGRDVECSLYVLTTGADTMLMVVEDILLPQRDSKISFYDTSWNPAPKLTAPQPALADWLTEEGRRNRADVERLLPFLLVEATYNPDTRILTYKHNMDAYFRDSTDRDALTSWLAPAITYSYTGKNFKRKR